MEPNVLKTVFGNEYFRINKKLLEISGLWPHQIWIQKTAIRTVVLFIFAVLFVPCANGVRIHCVGNMQLCAENFSGVMYLLGCSTKYFVTILSEESMRSLYQEVARTWLSVTDPAEKPIMKKYAKIGYWKTVAYAGYMMSTGVYFSQICLIPVFLDVIAPLNESRKKILPVNTEYFFDPYRYFYGVYLLYSLGAIASVATFTAIDTTYTVVVHQVLGMFSVVKYRIRIASQGSEAQEETVLETIRSSIELHVEALKFINLIESTYDLCFLVLVGICVPYLAFGAILIMETMHDPAECLRYILFEIGMLFHVLFMSWPGQLVTDGSFDILTQIYATEWYNLSERPKTLLKIMMTRCLKPTFITAAGLYIMNFENYAMMVRSTCSYITVLKTFRE